MYIADFIVEQNDGSKEILETKGPETPTFRMKWLLTEALYSEKYRLTCLYRAKGFGRRPGAVIEY